MDKNDVTNKVIAILANVQTWSGRSPAAISGNTKPIGDLEGFDSVNGVEVIALIGAEFGLEIDRSNMLVNESGNEASSVSDVAGHVHKLLQSKGKVS